MKRVVIAAAILASPGWPRPIPTCGKDGVLCQQGGAYLCMSSTKGCGGQSACNGGCAAAWPLFAVANAALAGGETSPSSLREDGGSHGLYRANPLPLRGRQQAENVTVTARGEVWHAASTGKSTPRRMLGSLGLLKPAPKFAGPWSSLRFAGSLITVRWRCHGQRVSWLTGVRGGRRPSGAVAANAVAHAPQQEQRQPALLLLDGSDKWGTGFNQPGSARCDRNDGIHRPVQFLPAPSAEAAANGRGIRGDRGRISARQKA